MDQLKSLFESKVLNDETKTVIREAWDTAVNAHKAELETEYAEKLNEAVKDLNAESIKMVEEAVAEELGSVAEELAEARSLEIEYAEKLQTFKEEYAEKTDELVKQLVSETVKEELDELKEDIDFAKKHQFGAKMFEAFQDSYQSMFGSSDVDIHGQLEETKKELDEYRRKDIISSLLTNVAGEKRAVVETILDGVPTDRLETKFESLRPVIMKETSNDDDNGESTLNESDSSDDKSKGKLVMENSEEDEEEKQVNESIEDRVARQLSRSLRYARK